jgi:hypothetical protein
MLLGTGEYSHPSNITSLAQSTFIRLLRSEAEEVINDLEEVWPIYLEALATCDRIINYRQLAEDPSCVPLNEALNSWAAKYNLDADWCKDTALRAFEYWGTAPEDYDTDYWEGGGWTDVPMEIGDSPDFAERSFTFSHSIDGLIWSTREQIVSELRSEFERVVSDYVNHLENVLRDAGHTISPKKRSADHFIWFIRYQVQKKSQNKIVQEFNQDRTTVRDGIHSIAELIKLPLRPTSRPGRPRRQQTK